jgi:hypothetical protein
VNSVTRRSQNWRSGRFGTTQVKPLLNFAFPVQLVNVLSYNSCGRLEDEVLYDSLVNSVLYFNLAKHEREFCYVNLLLINIVEF